MLHKVIPKTSVKAAVETKKRLNSKIKSKAIPRKIYFQYAGKEIEEDSLIEKFKFEWCKEYKINELKDFKIYYKIEDRKAYFVANESVTIVISF